MSFPQENMTKVHKKVGKPTPETLTDYIKMIHRENKKNVAKSKEEVFKFFS